MSTKILVVDDDPDILEAISLILEAHGYQVTVTELVGWEHSMKNELIVASHKGTPRMNAQERLEQILRELNLEELRDRFIY